MAVRIRALLAAAPLFMLAAPHALAATQTAEEDLVAPAKDGALQKLGPWLANLNDEYQQAPNKQAFQTANPIMKVYGGMVGVDLHASDPKSLQASLKALGASRIRVNGPLVSAQVPVSALSQLAALGSLNFGDAALSHTRSASQGSVVSQGDIAQGSNIARTNTGLDGTGITVGVLSDSYNCNPPAYVTGAPNSTAAQDAATQDVPPNVQVLDNGECPATDEGRAIVQLVHDVAHDELRLDDTIRHALAHAADRAVEKEKIAVEPLQIILIVGDRLERRRALARAEVRHEHLEAGEMVDRPLQLRLEDGRLHAFEVEAALPFEDVVGDALLGRQPGAVDPGKAGEIRLRRRPLARDISVGNIVAEPVGVAKVAAEQRLERVAPERRFVAVVEQLREPLALAHPGRRRGWPGGGRRRGGREAEGRHRGQQQDCALHLVLPAGRRRGGSRYTLNKVRPAARRWRRTSPTAARDTIW